MSALGQKQTYAAQHCMSALGQKRTCAVQKGMSALPPKADKNAYTHVDAAGCTATSLPRGGNASLMRSKAGQTQVILTSDNNNYRMRQAALIL